MDNCLASNGEPPPCIEKESQSNAHVEPVRRCSRLASKHQLDKPQGGQVSMQPSLKKRRITNAEAVKAYRARMEEQDPAKYKSYMDANKDRCKSYRANLSEEKRTEQREKARIRMQKKRAKDKEKAMESANRVTRNDAARLDIQRQQWREQKKNRYDKMNDAERAEANKKRREAYAAKKKEKKLASVCKSSVAVGTPSNVMESDLNTPSSFNSSFDSESDTRTPAAKRVALHRARKAISDSPVKYTSTVQDLISKASPRKKRLLEERGIISTTTPSSATPEHNVGKRVIEACRQLKRKGSKLDRHTRKVLLGIVGKFWSSRAAGTVLEMDRKTIQHHRSSSSTQKKKKVSAKKAVEDQAAEFIIQTSTTLPDKKLVSKKTGLCAGVLTKSLKEIHADFCSQEGQQVPFSTFAKCRPKHIRTMAKASLRQCLCEYCTNVELKGQMLSKSYSSRFDCCRLANIYQVADITMCARPGRAYKKTCAYRECDNCGVNKLADHLQSFYDIQSELTWQRWEYTTVAVRGKQVSRKMLVTKTSQVADFMEELLEEVKFLSGHLYRADWQHQQFEHLRKKTPFPAHTVSMVLDFAENYTCTYQNEVQAAHWHKTAVTLHPIVCYYTCPNGCGEPVTESLAFVSNDTIHDFNAVHHFTRIAVDHLTNARGICLQRIIEWTDGCASQYKSKGPFADISHAFQDYGVAFERHFFGSRHGKGPSDGESAVIKSHAFNATKSGRADIATAEDLFNYCQTSVLNKQPHGEQCQHFLRTFFWVAEGQILRQRGRQVQTLKGTRSLHAIRCIETNTVATRELSCMCNACFSGIGECSNMETVAPWQNQVLKAVAPARQPGARRHQIQQRVRRQLAVRANRRPAHVRPAAHVSRQLFASDTDSSNSDGSSPLSPLSPCTPEAAAADLPPEVSQSPMEDRQDMSDTDICPLPSPTPAADLPPEVSQSPMEDMQDMSDTDICPLPSPTPAADLPPEVSQSPSENVPGVTSPNPRTAVPVDATQPRKLAVNDCVVVRYPDRNYPGVILESVGTSFKVNFLRPHKTKAAIFVYPDPPDVQMVVPEMVVATAIELLPCNSSFREWKVTGFSRPWTN